MHTVVSQNCAHSNSICSPVCSRGALQVPFPSSLHAAPGLAVPASTPHTLHSRRCFPHQPLRRLQQPVIIHLEAFHSGLCNDSSEILVSAIQILGRSCRCMIAHLSLVPVATSACSLLTSSLCELSSAFK